MAFFRIFARHSASGADRVRWLIVLVFSLMLHLMIFSWADGRIGFPAPRPPEPIVISAALLVPPPAPPKAVKAVQKTAAPPKPRPVRNTKEKPKPAAPKAPPPEPVVSLNPGTVATPEPSSDTQAGSADGVSDGAPPFNEDAPALADVMPSMDDWLTEPAPANSPVAPPSAELHYDVYAERDGNPWYGSGRFRWESDGQRYRLAGQANITILFNLTVLNFASEGLINDSGIAPVLYSEKPWRKTMSNTHFRHAEKTINFSGSSTSAPYHGGEQDRASVIWQLASIGHGAPERFYPGAQLEVSVAGSRDVTPWQIQVLGEEEIETALGPLQAWHLARMPHSGSHDQRIDVWLAPQQDWYPVKVRHTYSNGDYLDLSLSKLTPLDAADPTRMED